MATSADVRRMERIAAHLDRAGVKIRYISGWKSRGRDWTRTPAGITDHHDASSRKSGEWGNLGAITYGRRSPTVVSGPLSQFQVARCLDGIPKVAIVAAGRANHAGTGGPYGRVPQNAGNSWLYGAEKANNGVSEPYTPAAMYAAKALYWAVLQETSSPGLLLQHKEWAPRRKVDSRYSGAWMRREVAAFQPSGRDRQPSGGDALTDQEMGRVMAALEIVRRGDTDGDFRGWPVSLVQFFLVKRGYLPGGFASVSGIFDAKTDAALRQFQKDKGLRADGIAGPKTYDALVS